MQSMLAQAKPEQDLDGSKLEGIIFDKNNSPKMEANP
jgi:hypothetical protein